MRFSLRTLLIVMALAPPLLVAAWLWDVALTLVLATPIVAVAYLT